MFPQNAAESRVPRMPPLGNLRESCIPNKDDPISANEAPAVGWSESWVVVVCVAVGIRIIGIRIIGILFIGVIVSLAVFLDRVALRIAIR